MRLILLVGLLLGACTGGCGHTKPLKELSSSKCVTWQCPDKGECTCVDK